jgi:SAM-dependent methyltransferase
MSIERPKEYYDEIYKTSDKYKCAIDKSEYFALWKKVFQWMPIQDTKIIELGCGVGQFAQLLKDNGYENYEGLDFSPIAIIQAKQRNIDNYGFYVHDLTDMPTHTKLGDGFFVALELFEHTKDFKIIENIGLGKEIIFTVPDFNDPAHVRYFHSVNEVVERYKNVIKFEHVQKFEHWYICKGVTI